MSVILGVDRGGVVAAVGTPKGNGDSVPEYCSATVRMCCSGWNAERQWRRQLLGPLVHRGVVAAVGTPKGNGDSWRWISQSPPRMVAAVGTPKGNGDVLVVGEGAAEPGGCSGWNAERQWRPPPAPAPGNSRNCCSGWNAERQWRLRHVPFALAPERGCSGWNAERQWRPFRSVNQRDQRRGCSGWNAERQWRPINLVGIKRSGLCCSGWNAERQWRPINLVGIKRSGLCCSGWNAERQWRRISPNGAPGEFVRLQRLERRKAMETSFRFSHCSRFCGCSGWNAERQWRLTFRTDGTEHFGVAAVGTPKGNGDRLIGREDDGF